eukprot:3205415-Pleurochrysis_carterae.AAC.1
MREKREKRDTFGRTRGQIGHEIAQVLRQNRGTCAGNSHLCVHAQNGSLQSGPDERQDKDHGPEGEKSYYCRYYLDVTTWTLLLDVPIWTFLHGRSYLD